MVLFILSQPGSAKMVGRRCGMWPAPLGGEVDAFWLDVVVELLECEGESSGSESVLFRVGLLTPDVDSVGEE